MPIASAVNPSAVFPVASGTPILSGGYIPTLFALKILIEFYKSTVVNEIANTDYEGMIQTQGDTVVIRDLPEPTIRNYVIGQELSIDAADPGDVLLEIDKGKYFQYPIDDVERVQSDLAYQSKWTEHFGRKLAIEIDRDFLATIPADVDSNNTGANAGLDSQSIDLGSVGAAFQLTKTNIIEKIVDTGLVLDEQDVPEDGRFLVLPSWAISLIKKSDLKDASLAGDPTSISRTGLVGMIDRFKIFRSNNLDIVVDGGDDTWNSVFGHPVATTFASQMTKSETIRSEKRFGDNIRTLQVYGFKVVKPEGLGRLLIKQ